MKNLFKKMMLLVSKIVPIETDRELRELRKSLKVRRKWFHRRQDKLPSYLEIIGNKPDEVGVMIPNQINNDYVMGNLGSIPKYYMDNISGQKAGVEECNDEK